MAQYSDALLQEIRTRLDIADFIGQYVPLKRAGVNLRGLCPFHTEKSPSFHVHPEKQIYRCFGCGVSGNIFGFLMQYEGLSFPEAVRELAEKAGVKLETDPTSGASKQLNARLKQIHKIAAQLYTKQLLQSKEAENARSYLKKRGLTLGHAEEFGLGYAPDRWDFLKNALMHQGFDTSEIEQAGLIKRAEEGNRSYDRFRNRLMFPIADPYGVVIAFSGRTLGDDAAKYINSPESPLYKKGQCLFGLSWAKEAAKAAGYMVLVEGNFDCVLPWSRGLRQVVAPLGTAFTHSHVRLLKRYTDRVILLFDQDDAGQNSQRKATEMLIEEGLQAQIAILKNHKDPADCIEKEGIDIFKQQLEKPQEAISFYAKQALLQMQDETPRAKAQAMKSVLPLIEKIVDPIERSESIAYVALELGIQKNLVQQEVQPAANQTSRKPSNPLFEADELELRMLRVLAARPDLFVSFMEQQDPHQFKSALARELFHALSELHNSEHPPQFADLLEKIIDPGIRNQLTTWAFEDTPVSSGFNWNDEFQGCVAALQRRQLSLEGKRLLGKIQEAEKNKDVDLQNQLLLQSVLLAKEKHAEHSSFVAAQSNHSASPERLRLKAPSKFS